MASLPVPQFPRHDHWRFGGSASSIATPCGYLNARQRLTVITGNHCQALSACVPIQNSQMDALLRPFTPFFGDSRRQSRHLLENLG